MDPEYGVDSRYDTPEERAKDGMLLMEARLRRIKARQKATRSNRLPRIALGVLIIIIVLSMMFYVGYSSSGNFWVGLLFIPVGLVSSAIGALIGNLVIKLIFK